MEPTPPFGRGESEILELDAGAHYRQSRSAMDGRSMDWKNLFFSGFTHKGGPIFLL